MSVVVKIGQVEAVEGDGRVSEDNGALRVKARIQPLDSNMSIENLPWCFPLLPRTLQTIPKVGEAVLIINSVLDADKSQRYYIGPIISQPQKMEKDDYTYGRGTALANIMGGYTEPLERLSNYGEATEWSFPKEEQVALIGRSGEDVILDDGEIDLRCGIRKKPAMPYGGLKGNVVFNTEDPAYLQLRYMPGVVRKQEKDIKGTNSVANLVADKINLISHQDRNYFKRDITDQEHLVNEERINELMDKLQPAVLGNELVELLTLMRQAILHHSHSWANEPPYIMNTVCEELSKKNIKDVLSNNVRLS